MINKELIKFFDLPEDTQQKIVIAYRDRTRILAAIKDLKDAEAHILSRINEIRESCEHPLLIEKYTSNEDEYGKLLKGGHTTFSCPDCGKRWTEYSDE